MVTLLGKQYSKNDLLRYTGNISQIAGVSESVILGSKAGGMRMYHVRNGNGLTLDLLPDKCLDIASLSYKGINFAWQSKTGLHAPGRMHPVLGEFDRYFGGGMLWTCGLKNTGPDYIDEDGFFQHAHGRIGITPCDNSWAKASWDGNDYCITAGGTVRDAMLGAHHLQLTREITVSMANNEIHVVDILENLEPESTVYLILYHFNFGFPFISEDINMVFGESLAEMKPRTEAARQGIAQWNEYTKPVDGFEEHCYFHEPAPRSGSTCVVSLENSALGVGVKISYDNANLPILTEWKSVRSGEYVLGIEPGNSYISGMANEKKNGRVDTIGGFDKKVFDIRLSFYDA